MLGMLKIFRLPIKLTIASAWKNAFNRRWGCDLKEIYPTTKVQPHQLDAVLIAIYGMEKGLGILIDYDVQDIIAQVENTSLIGIKR